jgi:hypothetical protein
VSTSRTTYRLLPLILVLALFAACGGRNAAGDEGLATLEEPGQSGEGATTTTASAADVEEAALAFSQCMRDEGVTDFPDPQFSEGGGGVTLGSPDGEDGGIDFQSDEVQAAFEACGELLERAAFGPGGGNFDETELQDNLLAMAECLRDQGLDVDDPDLSNFGPVAGGPPPDDEASEDEGDGEGTAGTPRTRVFSIFRDLDMDDPVVQAAIEACQEEIWFGRDQVSVCRSSSMPLINMAVGFLSRTLPTAVRWVSTSTVEDLGSDWRLASDLAQEAEDLLQEALGVLDVRGVAAVLEDDLSKVAGSLEERSELRHHGLRRVGLRAGPAGDQAERPQIAEIEKRSVGDDLVGVAPDPENRRRRRDVGEW